MSRKVKINKQLVKLATLLFLISIANNTFAQNYLWAKRAGGNSTDKGQSVTTDNSGNIITTGFFDSPIIAFGNTNLVNPSTGYHEAYLVKYNGDGNLLWAKKIGGIESEIGASVCVDSSGNIILVGSFESASITIGITTLPNSGIDDIFVAKFYPNGDLIWAKGFGGPSMDNPTCVTTDSTGNIIFCGNYTSPSLNFGNITLTNQGSYDLFMTKLNPNGNVLWAKNFGGTNFEIDAYVKCNTNGEIFLSGSFASDSISIGNSTLNNTGLCDIFLAKFDNNGEAIWSINEGGTDYDFSSQISLDTNGNVYLIGDYSSASMTVGPNTLINSGFYDIVISKFNSNGTAIWAKSYGGSSSEDANSIICEDNGSVFASFSFSSTAISSGNFYFNNVGNSDILLMKLDSLGNSVWAQSIGGIDSEECTSMTLDVNKNLIFTGGFRSQPLVLGSINLNNAGGDDVLLTKIAAASITEIDDQELSLVELYPNPANDVLNVLTAADALGKNYFILDVTGKAIFSGQILDKNASIPVENLANGYYTIIIDSQYTGRFLKQ